MPEVPAFVGAPYPIVVRKITSDGLPVSPLADAKAFSGQSQESVEISTKATRLDPNYSAPYLSIMGRAQYDLREFASAIENLERAASVNPKDTTPLIVLIAAYGQSGLIDRVAPVLDKLNQQLQTENNQSLTIDWIKYLFPYRDNIDREHLLEGLRKAGIPEW